MGPLLRFQTTTKRVKMFDQDNLLESGLYHFRVIVETIVGDPDSNKNHLSGAYYRTYGITAASAVAAVQIIESELEKAMTQDVVREITVASLHPDEIPEDTVDMASIQEPGVHFVSGRIYFDPAEENQD